ncbi:spore coat protein U domain-containing protein [Neisseria mucosa]|uniref:spore coat protein U domain-containing protein n=1 Tax=Neisseria mucosa TaxID=488 RepID=UPI00076A695F|nr:spore coat protein U domain-containing protein [Neisseria mucosa]MBF1292589.1 spore coat protein U domain-containing protein [Neisseria sp.]OFN31541.1 hypothetical protein HMPREF2568_08285 [Neisseria sp. HMSC059F02]
MKTRFTLTSLALASLMMMGNTAMADVVPTNTDHHLNVYIKLTGSCETFTVPSGQQTAINTSNPTLSGADINFGTHQASSTTAISNQSNVGGATSGISIKCSKNTQFQVAMTPQNVQSENGVGKMKVIGDAHTDTITYTLHKPKIDGSGLNQQILEEATETPWGNGNNALSLTGQGFGTEIKLPVYASIQAGELDKYVGEYQDRVKVTLTY